MTELNVKYQAPVALTWTLAGLTSSTTAGRECTAIDNSVNKYDDYAIQVTIAFPNSATSVDKTVYFYAGGWDRTSYQGGLTGTDAAYTFDDITTTPSPLTLCLAAFQVINKTRIFRIPSIATVFGGVVPEKFGLAAINYSGQTLTSGSATAQGISFTAA